VTSCTTLNQVSIPGTETTAAVPAVQVGDPVVITTRTGEKKKFKVTAIEPDALAGKSVRVLYTDMANLRVKESSMSTGAAVALALVVLGILIVVGADAIGDGIEEGIEAGAN
jgi:hypothetical protein